MNGKHKSRLLWIAGALIWLQTVGAAAEAPQITLRASRDADGAITLVLLGRQVGEFSALSADLRFGDAPLTGATCVQPPAGTPKTILCSQPSQGLVKVLLTGFGDEPLGEGELIRVQCAPPTTGRAGHYPVSALVRFARPDGSEFEIGPVGTMADVRLRRAR